MGIAHRLVYSLCLLVGMAHPTTTSEIQNVPFSVPFSSVAAIGVERAILAEKAQGQHGVVACGFNP